METQHEVGRPSSLTEEVGGLWPRTAQVLVLFPAAAQLSAGSPIARDAWPALCKIVLAVPLLSFQKKIGFKRPKPCSS